MDETIRYSNNTGVSLPDLVLAVEPNLWVDCFKLDSLSVNGLSPSNFILEGDRLQVPLLVPLEPGEVVDITLHYELHLPAADSLHVFGYNSLQINLVDWFPFIVPYSAGWLLHPPARVGEHLVYDKADFDVTISMTDEMDEIRLAASAPGGKDTRWLAVPPAGCTHVRIFCQSGVPGAFVFCRRG